MSEKSFCLLATGAAFLIRTMVSLHPYSGQDKSPMFGDFEAQRHWQEITYNLPISDWYENTTDNDLLYWGLDYPPLTAYHSWFMGRIAHGTNSSYVELHKSRGISTESHKHFMRLTVLFADLLLYLPALIWCCTTLWKQARIQRKELCFVHLIVALLYPGQILIDNGHFQYNNVSLGFAALSIGFFLYDRVIVGSVFFVLALNYKQMELYHALPIFCYLLAYCFAGSKRVTFNETIRRFTKLALVVITMFTLIWLPWLFDPRKALQVIHRIFPLARGVFEDKVSNIWCILNVVYPLKEHFTNNTMAVLCITCTLASVFPSLINLFMKPDKRTFLLSLINTATSFFLFSFQVHEKSILLVTLPVILYFPYDPIVCLWFLQTATFSMFPLLLRDGLLIAYIAINILYLLVIRIVAVMFETENNQKNYYFFDIFKLNSIQLMQQKQRVNKQQKKQLSIQDLFIILFYSSLASSFILILCNLLIPPPIHLPHIFPLVISALSCGQFCLFWLYFNEIVDESDGCGGKFNAIIVSPQFEGKSLLQRHRLVNGTLADELKTIHAFSQKTFTPAQWTKATSY